MIPKIVHYIWFGNKPIPNLVEENNKIFGDDWEIKIWTEKDFTFEECQWVKEAKSLNLYMYCSDALRFYIIKKYGGIYLDCDVKIERLPNSELLELPYAIGIEYWGPHYPNTGIIFGEKNNKVIKDIWNYYCSLSLIQDEEYYIQICNSDRLNNYNKNKSIYKAKNIQEFKDNYSKFDMCYFEAPGFETYKPELDYSFCNHNHTWYWKDVSVGYGNKFYVKPIPKIIHYCWISGEENMPEDIKQCISSWHKYLPEYQFINWNDSNFDWNICEFTKYNREQNNYAFCSDYIRFWALYNYGGIYLDTDVLVNKSFDELLNLNRIITSEIAYIKNNYLEAALMGFHKGDEILKECLDYYHTNPKFTKTNYVVSPDVLTNACKKYDKKCLNDISDYDKSKLNILSCNKYFDLGSEECFAQHLFKNSWCGGNYEDVFPKNYQIFLCAHKPIDNYIPNNKHYTIIDVSGTVKNDSRNIIDISQDEFTKTHNICYSEGCAMRWLWKHPEVIPDYIVFGHYRRMFLDFVNGNELFITRWVDNKGAIIQTPFVHTSNISDMYKDHQKDDIDVFIQIINEIAPEYYNAFQGYLSDTNQYACNCFAMKKEHFLEMCDFCFKILDEFDKRQGYKNNDSVMRKIIKNSHTNHLRFGINWQRRLQGFLLEYLTDTYYRYKFGVDKCKKCDCGIPNKPNNPFEK